MASIVFLVFVSFTVPSRIGFSIELDTWGVYFLLDIIVDLFFISDIFLNFRTAYWKSNGTIEVDLSLIARHYVKTWFVIDVVSSLPLGYAAFILPDLIGRESSAFKAFRMIRLFKLLRLVRLKRILRKYQDTFDLEAYLGIILTFATIIFVAHNMACFWYLVGTSSGSAQLRTEHSNGTVTYETAVVPGWVERDRMWCDPTGIMPIGGEPVCHMPLVEIQRLPFGIRYIRSLYTIFNSEFAYTAQESVFGVFGTLVIGFIYGGLAGVLSSLMMTQNAGEQVYMSKLLNLKNWMKNRNLNKRERARILSHFNAEHLAGGSLSRVVALRSVAIPIANMLTHPARGQVNSTSTRSSARCRSPSAIRSTTTSTTGTCRVSRSSGTSGKRS